MRVDCLTDVQIQEYEGTYVYEFCCNDVQRSSGMKELKNLWVIDDDFIFRTCAEIILRDEKMADQIDLIDGGVAALRRLQEVNGRSDQGPDLILLDLNMPQMSGWDFLNALTESQLLDFEKTTIYILTSSIDSRDQDKSKEYPIVKGFISKPLRVDNLIEIREDLGLKQHF